MRLKDEEFKKYLNQKGFDIEKNEDLINNKPFTQAIYKYMGGWYYHPKLEIWKRDETSIDYPSVYFGHLSIILKKFKDEFKESK